MAESKLVQLNLEKIEKDNQDISLLLCNMLTFLTDESKQVKQLSKNSINTLWSLSII